MIKNIYDNASVFKFNNYIVYITRIKNNVYGNPRFEASIFNLDKIQYYGASACSYRFDGHFSNLEGEALFILKHHFESNGLTNQLNELKKWNDKNE